MTQIQRTLGNSLLNITPLVFGGNVFGWTLDEKASFRILDAFVAHGGNMIDTADQYSVWVPGNKGGESETIIGKWMQQRGNRTKMIIATKVGGITQANAKTNTSKKHIMNAIEGSLKRLQTDYIDLYYTHFDDVNTPVAETMDAFQQLKDAGKIRNLGVSNMTVDRIHASQQYALQHSILNYTVLQPEYNLYYRQKFEETLLPVVNNYEMGVLTYFSLASGFLTGKYKSIADCEKSARGHSIKAMLNDRGLGIIAALKTTAKQYNTTPATMAIAWLLAQKAVTAPIVSATNEAQLESLLQALSLKLDTATLETLNQASAY